MSLSRLDKDWKLLIDRVDPVLPVDKLLNLGWQFTSYFLVVQVSAINQRDTWQAGGTIWATSYIKGYTTRFFTKQLDLFAQELIVIPNIFHEKYSLYYRAPKYFSNVKLKIWEYTGAIPESDDLSEKINLLMLQTLRTEELLKELISKIDNENSSSNFPTEQQKKLIIFF